MLDGLRSFFAEIVHAGWGCLIAFSMYSRLPVPMVEWTPPRMRYALCWFPAVGAVCGGLLWGWLYLAVQTGVHPVTAGLVGTVIPILVTGGIHLDGFLDTLDARSSYAGREKKLEILKDPHTGAFAMIGFAGYMLLYAGGMIQLYADVLETGQWDMAAAFCMVFPTERAFSGLSVVTFPCAKNSGLARSFSDGAQKRVTGIVLLFWILMSGGLLLCLGIRETVLVLGIGLLMFWKYKRMAEREFGGITGDLAGWFLQEAELGVLLGIVVVSRWLKL